MRAATAKGFALVAVAAALACAAAQATFLASTGFSGRYDIDCSACHTAVPVIPAATLEVDGVPDAYDPGATYRISVRVVGGPPALPAPAPQGGIEADIDAGRLRPAESSSAQLRNYAPHAVTYTLAGAMVRAWDVEWTAPGPWRQPLDANLWMAAVAANGDHVVALNVSDGGERLDAVATGHWTVPPTAAAVQAWRALPLAAPVVESHEPGSGGILVVGAHADANATVIAWRVDGSSWQERPAADAFRLDIQASGGPHILALRSVGAERTSDPVTLSFDLRSGLQKALPGPALAPMGLLLALAALRRR